MIACQCRYVSDGTIRELAAIGHDVATISEHCDVGNDCGTCISMVESIVESTRQATPR